MNFPAICSVGDRQRGARIVASLDVEIGQCKQKGEFVGCDKQPLIEQLLEAHEKPYLLIGAWGHIFKPCLFLLHRQRIRYPFAMNDGGRFNNGGGE